MKRFENTLRRLSGDDALVLYLKDGNENLIRDAKGNLIPDSENLDSGYIYDITGKGIYANELFISGDFVFIGLVADSEGYATKAVSYSFDFIKYFKYRDELAAISSDFVIDDPLANNEVYDES